MTERSDTALVARVLANQDMDAYGELIRRHQSGLRAWLRQLSRSPDDADDLAQDTLLHAFDKLHTFKGSGRFQSWLFRIAYSLFLQSRRKGKRREEVLQEVRQVQAEDFVTSLGETRSELSRLLEPLHEEERQVMVLCYAFGFSHSEISSVCELPLGTVKSMIHRGKARIREAFALQGTGT